MSLNENIINATYDRLHAANLELHKRQESYALCKTQLDRDIAQAMATGQIEGRNQQVREAATRSIFQTEFEKKEQLELHVHQSTLEFDLARIEVARLEMLMRFGELSKK